MDEIWLPIPSHPGYEASSLGRIRGVERVLTNKNGVQRRWKGRIRKLSADGENRLMVWIDGTSRYVHVLVAETFHGPRPDGQLIRHRNGDNQDNRPSNLRYGNQSENQHDAVAHGTHSRARNTHCPQGHPYSGDNVRVEKSGGRRCLTCKRESMRRSTGSTVTGPSMREKTHCKNGHEFTPENTLTTATQRVCRTCHRERERRRREARRTATP